MSTEAKIKHTPLDLEQFQGHTPGPWRTKTSRGERDVFSVKDVCGHVVARVSGYSISAISPGQRRANAPLIAAAPALLAELRRNRRLLEAGERLAQEGRIIVDQRLFSSIGKFASLVAAYQEAAKA